MILSRSFPARMAMQICLTVTVLLILAMAGAGIYTRRIIRDESAKYARLALETINSELDVTLKDTENVTGNMAWVVKEHLDDPSYMYTITQRMVEYNAMIVGSTVSFQPYYYRSKGKYFAPYTYRDEKTGEIRSIQMGNEDYDYFFMDWYSVPASSSISRWSEPYFDEGGGEQIMTTYSVPIHDDEGTLCGVLTADLSLNQLTDMIAEITEGTNAYTFLLGRSGAYISHPDKERLLTETIFDMADRASESDVILAADAEKIRDIGNRMISGETGIAKLHTSDDVLSLMVYGPLDNGWSLGMVCPYSDIYNGLTKTLTFIGAILIACLILMWFICNSIIRRNSQPITEITYKALNIAKGNFNASIPEVRSNDELKYLQMSLSYMLSSFHAYIDGLRTSTADNERYESELSIASQIQSSMLPKEFPQNAGFDLYATLHPAKEVGGDLYDFLAKGRYLYFTVGDVSGKGVPAALYMALSRSIFRYVSGTGADIATVVKSLSDTFCESNEGAMFITMFAGRIDLDTLEMTYCNAGHNPIIIISPDGTPQYLKAKTNIAAGLFEDFPYQMESMTLERGSRLVVYTDGVTEATNLSDELYGEERLLRLAGMFSPQDSSQACVERIRIAVKEFAGKCEQNDDITIMTVTV